MNYEEFVFWLEGYLEAHGIDAEKDNSVLGLPIYKKIKTVRDQSKTYLPSLPKIPEIPQNHHTGVSLEEPDLMAGFLDQYKDLPEEELPVFGDVPVDKELEWEVDDGKTKELKSDK